MGSYHRASCECGFKTSVQVGGNMRTHNEISRFPCYCDKCGLVEANVAKDMLECPKCESLNVIPYGDPRISDSSEKWPTLQWGNYKAPGSGNLCPECKRRALIFHSSHLMFD